MSIRATLVDLLRKTDAVTLAEEFSRSQWQSPEDIRATQLERLRALLAHAQENVPHYRRVMENAGLRPEKISAIQDLQRMPLLAKADIKTDPSAFMARNAARYQPRAKATGGSTGQPLRYWVDRKSHSASWAFIYRAWSQVGWRPGDRVVILGGSSLVPSFGAFKKLVYVRLNNWLLLSAFNMGKQSMLGWVPRVQRAKAPIMYCYASAGYSFAKFLEEQRISNINFRAVFTTAEVLQPYFREVIQRVFQCPVFDTYGGVDGAGYAFECDQHDGLHIVAESAIVETVQEDGTPCGEEDLGEVVTTDLFNYAMPFIRYRTGDLASQTTMFCSCGRGLPRLRTIQGRLQDILITMQGERVHPQFLDHVLRGVEVVQEFYAEQDRIDHIRLDIVPRQGVLADTHLERVREVISKKFVGTDIEIRLVHSIPPLPNGKFRYVVNKVGGVAIPT